mgnify:CR=1 FL=1
MKGNIKKVNGFKYSRVSFEDYKLRAIIKLTSKSVEYKVEFYTSNPDKVEALKGFKTFIKDVVDNVEASNWIQAHEIGHLHQAINREVTKVCIGPKDILILQKIRWQQLGLFQGKLERLDSLNIFRHNIFIFFQSEHVIL